MELRSGKIIYSDNIISSHQKYQDELNKKFFFWKSEIDEMFFRYTGYHLDDMPDEPYYDMFVENVTPIQVFYKLYSEHILPFLEISNVV